jgi:hypothetical protein
MARWLRGTVGDQAFDYLEHGRHALPNRGTLLGITTTDELLATAELADQSGLIGSVWVGDSLVGKPRAESLVLLTASDQSSPS